MQQPFMAFENDTDGFNAGNLTISNSMSTAELK